MKKGLKKPMNKQDKQDLELILYRLNEQDKSVGKLEKALIKNSMKYTKIFHSSKKIYSIPMRAMEKTKQNTQFRKSTTMWRGIIGGGLINLIGDMFWDWFSN